MIDGRARRAGLLAGALLGVLVFSAGCDDDRTDAGSSGELARTPERPTREQTGTDDPVDPLRQDIALRNPGAESLERPGDDGALPGWTREGDCRRVQNDVAAGNGQARFDLSPGCVLFQRTAHELRRDEGLSLVFDIAAPGGGPAVLLAELVAVDGDGNTVVLGERRLPIEPERADWQSRAVLSGFGAAEASLGSRSGIRLSHVSGEPIALDAIALSAHARDAEPTGGFADTWADVCDQAWAGEHWWANRLHDWEVRDGRLVTRNGSRDRPMRTIHRVTTVVREAPADFTFVVDTGIEADAGPGAWSGFMIGAGHRLDHRAAALVHNRSGRNGGLLIGIDADGRPFVHDNDVADERLAAGERTDAASTSGATLRLDGLRQPDGDYRMNVFVLDASGDALASTSTTVPPERVLGSVALVSNPGARATSHWFGRMEGFGAKLRDVESRAFGPVLFASYTLSRGTLTVNAQYPQSCAGSFGTPRLEAQLDGEWRTVASAPIHPMARTARFSVPDWDGTVATTYRIVSETEPRGETRLQYHEGTVQADPETDETLIIATYNCRPGVIISDEEGWMQQFNARPFTWKRERLAYPHDELLGNASRHEAHLNAFLGDQIYEFDPNGFVDKADLESIVDDYFWKWYQFGWAAREAMRDTPSFVIPDDHDVFQGNVWGQGGRPAETERAGGFVFPAAFVDVVRRTQTGSLPDPVDPAPLEQGLNPYFTDLVVGDVGIAVLEDRTFKTGPSDPDAAESPTLLGERQLAFLDDWARDWEGQTLKLAISQSPFSQSTTHSGAGLDPIGVDQDANGWPKAGRDRAVRALRRAYAPHIAGDQHLAMVLRHGVDAAADGVYSFAGPSMMNVFPRIWDPANATSPGPGDPASETLGPAVDAHGNLLDVVAVANPAVYYAPTEPGRTASKDELGIGYGIVRVDPAAGTYAFEAWPANVDPSDPRSLPYAQWPVTVAQTDNDGRVPSGRLTPRVADVARPVVEVIDETTGELIWARRYPSADVDLPVHDASATYRVRLSDPETGYEAVFENQRVVP